MNARGVAMRQRIRENTLSYIDNATPLEYQEILKPDYEPGCKHRVNTATYLDSLHSAQMHLAKDSVTKIGPGYVETKGGNRHAADVIIYATGFQTQKRLFSLQVKSTSGKDLHRV